MASIRDKLRPARLRPLTKSIRFRLTMWYVLILAMVLAVFSTIVYASQAQALRAQMNDALRSTGQGLAAAYNPQDGKIDLPNKPINKGAQLGDNGVLLLLDANGTPAQKMGEISDLDVKRLLVALQLQGGATGNSAEIGGVIQKLNAAKQDGTPIDQKEAALLLADLTRTSEEFLPFTLVDRAPNDSSNPDYLFYTTVLLTNNGKVGTLILGRPREDEAELQRLLWTLLMAAPATLLVAAAGGYWLAARAMRPVRTIAHAAQEIGETELHRRLNLETNDELGELAATFDGMLDRLESAFQRQRQFTADASHELRTPLTIVDLEVSHALTTPKTEEEYRRALMVIQDETACMARLVNDLLTLARADAGRIVLRREEIDLSDVALEVVERLAPLARQNGVQLHTRELPEVKISGDRLYLVQMLTNLVENAIKYSQGIQRCVSVEAGSVPDGINSLAWVRVEDNGPGIASDHLPRLFDRFYRVDKARSHNAPGEDEGGNTEGQPGGSGLGLSIVQWVADAHGGRVRVESRVGYGSTFEVLLPATPVGSRQ